MKEKLVIIMITIIMLIIPSSDYAMENKIKENNLKIGEVTGSFKKSNAIVSIHVKDYEPRTIPTYQVGDDLYICVEDLEYYGYNKKWDEKNRITTLLLANTERVGTVKYIKEKGNTFYSDVKIYVDGVELKAHNIGGYTLVRVEDLNKLPNLFFAREYAQEGKDTIDLKGNIKLPKGEIAPKGGITVNLVVYRISSTMNKGFPEKRRVKSFVIKEGQNYCDYEIKKVNTYEFIGYEIKSNYGYVNGALYDESNIPIDNYEIFVKKIEPFKINYNKFDIDIFKKFIKIKGNINLKDKLEYQLDGLREFRILAIDKNDINKNLYESKFMVKKITVPINERSIPFDMNLISDKEYILRIDATILGTFRSIHGMEHRPEATYLFSGYYSADGFVKDANHATIINTKENSIDNLDIPVCLEEATKKGQIVKSNIETYLNGDKIGNISINGEVFIPLDFLEGNGFTLEYDDYDNIYINNDFSNIEKKQNYVLYTDEDKIEGEVLGYLGYSIKKVYINNKEIANYSFENMDVVNVKELQKCGFNIVENDDSIEIKVNQ